MHSDYKQTAKDILSAASFNKYELPDISEYTFSNTNDEKAKMASFLHFVKNPYLFRVGDVGVHVVFSGKSGDTLQSHICNLLASKL